MEQWWLGLTGTEQFFWGTAIVSTAIFTLQTMVAVIGFPGGDGDAGEMDSGDFDLGDQEWTVFEYFSVRNIVAFLLGLSWGGLACLKSGLSEVLSALIGTVIGILFVFTVMGILKLLGSLKSEGNLSLENALGEQGTVTVPIPPKMEGYGKVNVSVQGRIIELYALTEEKGMARGQQVIVQRISGDKLVVGKVIVS